MNKEKANHISKKDFLKIKEKDVMFITNPGRMGDEDGSTFVVKEGNNFVIYRIDGWMYPKGDIEEDEYISLEDAVKQFPEWEDAWESGMKKDYNGKYKCYYMGFGNGLCIDNSIYEEYKPYLEETVKNYLEKYRKDEQEEMQYAAIFNTWEDALMKMIKEKK